MVLAFPVFRRPAYPKTGQARQRTKRAPGREGDYNYRWQQCRGRYIKAHPFCKFCTQEGRDAAVAEEIDHIIPLRDGGDRLKWANLQPLCKTHHNGLKRQMETYARQNGLLGKLVEWCDDPATRPRRFQRGG